MKFLPSTLVLDCMRVRTANKKRMSSRTERPGSFWWDDLTYRTTTAEPGILLKASSATDNTYDKKRRTECRLDSESMVEKRESCAWELQRVEKSRKPVQIPTINYGICLRCRSSVQNRQLIQESMQLKLLSRPSACNAPCQITQAGGDAQAEPAYKERTRKA